MVLLLGVLVMALGALSATESARAHDGPHELAVSSNGAKVTKRYGTATTPHQRAIGREDVRKRPVIQMNAEFKRIKPATLSRRIRALTGQFETLALAKKPAPVKPAINQAFNR